MMSPQFISTGYGRRVLDRDIPAALKALDSIVVQQKQSNEQMEALVCQNQALIAQNQQLIQTQGLLLQALAEKFLQTPVDEANATFETILTQTAALRGQVEVFKLR